MRVEQLGPSDVLTAARDAKRIADAAAAQTLLLACAWADQHPVLEPGDEATFASDGPDGGVFAPICGKGCPSISEYAVAEFGAVLGESTASAKRLIGHALELRHRLPRLWDLVQSGRAPAWRARLVAEATIHSPIALSPAAAAWVDSQVAACLGKVGTAQAQRLVQTAILQFALATNELADDDPDVRRVDLDGHDPVSGTVHLSGTLSLADGLDLDHVLSHRAAELKALGSTDSLDVRRSVALGDLARHTTALDLHGGADEQSLPPARDLVLNLHFDAATDGESLSVGPLGRLEKDHRDALLDHVKEWVGDSHTRVTIRPVIDLRGTLTAPGYAIPQRIRDHVIERDRTCMFPWCHQSARRCDLDHVTPYDHSAAAAGRAQPGPTSTLNLIPLCRRHHRLKTFTAWRVTMPRAGLALWTSPHGHTFRRDRDGTSLTQD